jgi:hypothetical protein
LEEAGVSREPFFDFITVTVDDSQSGPGIPRARAILASTPLQWSIRHHLLWDESGISRDCERLLEKIKPSFSQLLGRQGIQETKWSAAFMPLRRGKQFGCGSGINAALQRRS